VRVELALDVERGRGVRGSDLARASGLPMADVREVLIAMSDRGAAYLTPADEPRNIPAADLPYLVSGPSGKALYVTMRTLDMATQDGDTAISHDSPSSFSFDAVADSDLDREQLAAIEWARRTYGERIEALRLLGEHGSNSALHAGMAAAHAHGFQSAVKTALHKELLVFSSPMDVGMDAVSAAKSRNVLLVNKASRVSLLWLTGHELGHAINAQDPTLFQQWRQWVLSHVSDWSEHRAMLVNVC